ncbi:hypothetical protein LXM94_01900 [Rhizobium sp. TRM95111]|uniref:hypothetical protein n=1 Tax=Rhizobium alarense TaxID=2846851 RepID=UPI001F1DB293|nr:hypothetical protein [Rhizobium alarense]MCF3638724.1 hypothetical protein [Rhizobium alarense]
MNERVESQDIIVVPHQDYIAFRVFDDTVWISQEDVEEGQVTITIAGRENLDLVISALQKVREAWA